MKYLHSMVRVLDLEKSLYFYKELLGLKEYQRKDYEKGKFSLIFLGTETEKSVIELTYNWDQKKSYDNGKNFGHLAFAVKDIYSEIKRLQKDEWVGFLFKSSESN